MKEEINDSDFDASKSDIVNRDYFPESPKVLLKEDEMVVSIAIDSLNQSLIATWPIQREKVLQMKRWKTYPKYWPIFHTVIDDNDEWWGKWWIKLFASIKGRN